MRPSPAQLRLLRYLASRGTIGRWHGGFWASASEPSNFGAGNYHVPVIYFHTGTVNACHDRDWIAKTKDTLTMEGFRATYELTAAGRTLAELPDNILEGVK